jgi:hypothetical protein
MRGEKFFAGNKAVDKLYFLLIKLYVESHEIKSNFIYTQYQLLVIFYAVQNLLSD